jgi:EAL domain-containing protein (putative c-di-GMP-specific phosphodiesterase class I)
MRSPSAYLKQIDADELKLDKTLIDDVTRSGRDALITRSIVDLAHSLGMKVVAEGVETAATAAAVSALGCDVAQGYFFARPAPLPGLLEQLQTQDRIQEPAEEVDRHEIRSGTS